MSATLGGRSPQGEGFVNFPATTHLDSEDSGVVVKLLVVESVDIRLGKCCGGEVFDIIAGQLPGDEQHPWPDNTSGGSFMHHKLNASSIDFVDNNKYLDIPLRASIVMGTSPWSPTISDERWAARYDDLTAEGKVLYSLIKRLNPGCTLHLITCIDN